LLKNGSAGSTCSSTRNVPIVFVSVTSAAYADAGIPLADTNATVKNHVADVRMAAPLQRPPLDFLE
jgi:hypothetical protein